MKPLSRFALGGRGGGDAAPPSAGVAAAAARTGDITVFGAVNKYLGLKLGAQKYRMPVIVIYHVERIPTGD